MDERELEQRLRTAVEHAAPDPLDRILAACGPQAGTVLPFESPKKKRRWAPLAVAAALVVMCCGAFGISSWRGANAVDSVVMLDVNPSLSMTVSSKERVLSVTPFNQDAEVILGDMDLTGTDLDVAVNALIGSMLQNGYLSDIQNAILVSVENQDAAKSAQLQQHLTDTINSVFQGGSLEGAVLSQTVTESADLNALAQQYGISVGKASLIQEVIAQDSTLTFASLAPLSVNEIALIAESRHLTTQAVTQTGTASTKAYITAEEAKNAALAHAGIAESSVAQLEIEFDSEDGLMVYEVEFYAGGTEYDYDINARTGEVVNFSREGGISGGTTGSSGSYIGEAAATAAALTHAGKDMIVRPQQEEVLGRVAVVARNPADGHLIQRYRDGSHAVLSQDLREEPHKFLQPHRLPAQNLYKLVQHTAQYLPELGRLFRVLQPPACGLRTHLGIQSRLEPQLLHEAIKRVDLSPSALPGPQALRQT